MRTATRLAWSGVMALGVTTSLAAAERMAAVDLPRTAPAGTIVSYQGDPAEALYRDARRALNNSDFREAARLFERLRDDHASSEYVGDSYYFEAFALYRDGRLSGMERALDLLTAQENRHPDSPTREDAPSLRVQIEGQLARRGNQDAGQRVAERASGPCESDDQELRSMALNALLHMNADRALPILKEVLESRDECSVELRRQAVFLVSQHMTGETVDILLDLAHRNPDPDAEVREQAVFWLSQVNSAEAVDALESILRTSDDPELQEKAIFALSQQRSDSRAIDILKEYAERPDAPEELRENAIFWLGQSAEGGEYLRGLYASVESETLKEKIIFGVYQSGRQEDGDWLLERALDPSESVDVRKNALFWAGQMGLDVSRLAELYSSVSDREMKEQIIFVLSQSNREREAVDQLMVIVEEEEDAELKKNAIFWLGQSGDPRVAEFLLRLIRR